jgi:predicted AlkP superfamily pyrophosphatase or phosphodiesterase
MTRSLVTLLVAGLLFAAPLTAQQTPAAPQRPTLVVMLTVDQLAPLYFERYGEQLDGGLARIYRNGAVFLNGWQDHGITETAPGHATTLSGRYPRSTGIVMNDSGVPDPQAPVIGGGAGPASPFRFRGTTLTDWMRFADARTRALSVSRKDRSAILPMGRAHQEVYWYTSRGAFSTSTYYRDTLPTWVTRFNALRIPQSMRGRRWDLSRDSSLYREPDWTQAERGGRENTFPHWLADSDSGAAREFLDFPWMDDLTLSFALAGVRELGLGRGPVPDVLAISLSATDRIGHEFGPDSREAHDQFLRLDRALGAFFDSLFAIRDSTRIILALTADHGITPLPELRGPGRPATATRVDPSDWLAPFRDAIVARGAPRSSIALQEGILAVVRDSLAAHGIPADSLIRALVADIRRRPEVLRVYDPRSLARADTVRDAIARRWRHQLPDDVRWEALVTLRPYSIWSDSHDASHGSPHDADARVPIIFWGPQFRGGMRREHARVVDIAPTLAAVLGVRPMERLDGRVLTAILR